MSYRLTPQQSADTDQYLDTQRREFLALGDRLFESFNRRGGQINTQVRNLQQIVCSAARFSDIENFIKSQMGREHGKSQGWRQVGRTCLDQLEQLRCQADQSAQGSPEVALTIRLRLARGWVRSVVSQYLFRKASEEMEEASRVDQRT